MKLQAAKGTERASKYRNKKTEVDGIKFDSKKEAKRYGELKMMLRAGLIVDLELQINFPIVLNDTLICTYRSDFVYMKNGERIVEDVKGIKTPIYRLKKKLMKACWNIEISEV